MRGKTKWTILQRWGVLLQAFHRTHECGKGEREGRGVKSKPQAGPWEHGVSASVMTLLGLFLC